MTPTPLTTSAPDMTAPSSPSLLQRLKRTVYPLASRYFANASLVEGQLKGSETTLRVLFVHNCLFNLQLRQRLFETSTTLSSRRVWLPGLAGELARQRAAGVDLVSAVLPPEVGATLAGLPQHQAHEEVRQVIATDMAWEELRKGFSKKKRQTTNDFGEKNGLNYRISHEPADLEHFYHRMHVPHIRRRYGELADLDSFEAMRAAFEDHGRLLFVMDGERAVAGALSQRVGDTLVFRRSGVLDGDETHVKGGAQTALYYFQLRDAVDSGIRAVDAMNSSAFLNDGVFKHKADWGARSLRDEVARRRVHLLPFGPAERIARFFELNPMVIDEGDDLAALIGDCSLVADQPLPADKLRSRYHLVGLKRLHVLTPHGRHTIELPNAPAAA